MKKERKILIFSDIYLENNIAGKGTEQLVRFREKEVYGVIVREKQTISQKTKKIFKVKNINIYNVEDLKNVSNNDEYIVMIGFSPVGGEYTTEQLSIINILISLNLKIVNGLHQIIENDQVMNIRNYNSTEYIPALYEEYNSKILLTIGSDHSNGKMTFSALYSEFLNNNSSFKSEWIPTGQTGMMVKESGLCIDAIKFDYIPGELDNLIRQNDKMNLDLLIVEGQGAITHHSTACGPLVMYQVIRPQFVVITHKMRQVKLTEYDYEMQSIGEIIDFLYTFSNFYKFNCKIIGISINTSEFSEDESLVYLAELEKKHNIACFDPVRFPYMLKKINEVVGREI